MPCSKLLWDYLGQQKPFAGYVKNLAADGAYNWVVALVLPIDDGYLSVRVKPSSQFFPIVQQLSAELLATERKAGRDGGAWREGMRRPASSWAPRCALRCIHLEPG